MANAVEMWRDGLTAKQARFVEEYCVDGNAAAAARRAGYSTHTARSIGHENLTKPHIKEAVEARMEELSMSAAEAQMLLSQQARASIDPFITEDEAGHVRVDMTSEEARKHRRLVKKLKVRRVEEVDAEGNRKVKTRVDVELHDAQAALGKIARIRGLYNEKRGQTTRVGILVVPPPREPGELTARQREILTERGVDGVYRSEPQGTSGARGVISTRAKERDDGTGK